MKKHIIILAVAFLFFGTQIHTMSQKQKESLFRSFLNHLVLHAEDIPAGEDASQYYKDKTIDGAKLYGLQPAEAKKIYIDFAVDFALLSQGIAPTDPGFNELKAQFMKDNKDKINAEARGIFPQD